MARYSLLELGPVQRKILKHIFDCQVPVPESVSHISKELGILQPSVQRSVKLLVEAGYLLKGSEHIRGKKDLSLTDKGAAAAVICGADLDQFENNRNKHKSNSNLATDALKYFGKITTTSKKRNLIVQKAMEYALKNDIFKEGHFRNLTPEEEEGFQRYLMIEYMNSLGPASNIQDLKEFFDRYQLNKEFLKESLTGQKKLIDILLKELDRG